MNANVYQKCRQSEYDTDTREKEEGNKREKFNRL